MSRILAVAAFAPFFGYLLAFPFEGQTLYSVAEAHSYDADLLLFPAMAAHFLGLAFCWIFVRTAEGAKRALPAMCALSAALSLPFFFAPSALWLPCITAASFAAGIAVASWGFVLRDFVPADERVMCCADALIFSNVIMIAINVVSAHISARLGLAAACAAALSSAFFARKMPAPEPCAAPAERRSLARPMALLCLFVFIITIDSGLMYQVLNPAFAHLTRLVSWYWALPYIAALALMRGLPRGFHRSLFLYLAIAMIMLSFILFMFIGRGAGAYIVVDTLMLGACGIFDLFWWSIAAALLDRAENPARIFGGCLAANVFGVLTGGALGAVMTAYGVSAPKVAVTALAVVCVTMALLPLLNVRLLALLKEHTFLSPLYRPAAPDGAAEQTPQSQKDETSQPIEDDILPLLTDRESDILPLLLSGKKNREIAEELGLNENTIKTHARNIYAKYGVSSRTDLVIRLKDKHIPTN